MQLCLKAPLSNAGDDHGRGVREGFGQRHGWRKRVLLVGRKVSRERGSAEPEHAKQTCDGYVWLLGVVWVIWPSSVERGIGTALHEAADLLADPVVSYQASVPGRWRTIMPIVAVSCWVVEHESCRVPCCMYPMRLTQCIGVTEAICR